MTAEIFQTGSSFPAISGSAICLNGQEEMRKLKILVLKAKIKEYLETHNRVRTSDLAEIFNESPRLIGVALRELEEDGLIKDTN